MTVEMKLRLSGQCSGRLDTESKSGTATEVKCRQSGFWMCQLVSNCMSV
jgi:hypothetical protein